LIENQIIGTKLVDQKFIDDVNTSTHFTSGRKIEIGDKLIHAFCESKEGVNCNLRMIKLHPEEYDMIYEDAFEDARSDKFPTLKLKNGWSLTDDGLKYAYEATYDTNGNFIK
jgi:hypothetical protein